MSDGRQAPPLASSGLAPLFCLPQPRALSIRPVERRSAWDGRHCRPYSSSSQAIGASTVAPSRARAE